MRAPGQAIPGYSRIFQAIPGQAGGLFLTTGVMFIMATFRATNASFSTKEVIFVTGLMLYKAGTHTPALKHSYIFYMYIFCIYILQHRCLRTARMKLTFSTEPLQSQFIVSFSSRP